MRGIKLMILYIRFMVSRVLTNVLGVNYRSAIFMVIFHQLINYREDCVPPLCDDSDDDVECEVCHVYS